MNIAMMRRAAEYLIRLCLLNDASPEQVDFYPQKLRSVTDFIPPKMPARVSPESVGINSAYLTDFLRRFEEDEHAEIHNLLIYRDGKLISAASAPGYSPRLPSMTFSLAKSVTSLAVGCLIGDGLLTLDTRLVDVLPEDLPLLIHSRTKKITIRHLLTMTAGVTGVHEVAAVTLSEWKRAFLATTPSSVPGKNFFYNSLNSYMLAAVVEKITGRNLEDYLRGRLFEPLGITNYDVERSAENVAKGGWGMYLTPLDMAKLGQLLLADGVWDGIRLLPHDYIAEAMKPQITTFEEMGDYDYGFHMWASRNGKSVIFHGMFGQHVWIRPDTGMVIVITCGNDELYLESSTVRRIDEYFGNGFTPEDSLPDEDTTIHQLRLAEQNFFCARHGIEETGKHPDYFYTPTEPYMPAELEAFLGEYEFTPSNVGLLPFYWRCIQNNHNPGISRIAFRIRDGRLYMCVTEGTEREILCGFSSHAYSVLNYRGERYLVGTLCTMDEENDMPTISVEMVFPELPFSRKIKYVFHDDDTITVYLTETPGSTMLYALAGGVGANIPWLGTIASIVKARMGDIAPQALIALSVEPILKAKCHERTDAPPELGIAEKKGFFYRLVPRNWKRLRARLPRLPHISRARVAASFRKLWRPFKTAGSFLLSLPSRLFGKRPPQNALPPADTQALPPAQGDVPPMSQDSSEI